MWSHTRSVRNINRLRCILETRALSNRSYLHNPGSEPLNYATLGEVIAATANAHPGRVAVRSVHEDITLTYEQLLKQADSLGCSLRERGLNKGDRLGIWSHNSASWIIACVAAARTGLISVLLNPVYEKREISYCLNKTGIKCLYIGEKLGTRHYYNTIQQLIPDLMQARSGAISSTEFPSLTTIITNEKEQLEGTTSIHTLKGNNSVDVSKYEQELSPDEGCIIHLTSGTSGEPKAGLDSHFSMVNNSYFIGKRNQFHEGHQKICVQAPLFHALGSVVTLIAGLSMGGTIVLAAPSYNVDANLNALYQEQCTAVTGTPTMFIDLLSKIKASGKTPNLQMALAAGAPCSPQLIRDIQKYMNADSVKGLYGLTETTASVFQSIPGDSIEQVAETVGYIQDHVEVKVVDENGKQVPFGSSGELLVRGYNTMMYYWDDPEKTNQTLGKDGWLQTGDKFTISEDGYGKIVGRLKDIIVRGGENIAPKEIEDLLNTHPDVVDSQVVGVADDRLGEELCAVLRIKEGATFSLQDLRSHCSGHLAKFKIPRILKIVEDFPKTTSGKVQKYKLRDMLESGKL